MDALLEPITRSLQLPRYLDELNAFMRSEAQRREQFRDDLRGDDKAEFINGEVVVHSPARLEHSTTLKHLLVLIDAFVQGHDLGEVLVEKAMVNLTRNDYEPDLAFWGKKKSAAFDAKQMLFPPPDFVVEILSPSTASRDRGVKFDDYAAHGVAEYWIVDPAERLIEQYTIGPGGAYALQAKLTTGEVTCQVIAGLRIPVSAVFERAANRDALRAILGG